MIRFQYRLRSLLIFVTIVAIPFGLFSWKRNDLQMRHMEIEIAKRTMGCNIYYAYEMDGSPPPGPAWIRRWLGDDAFDEPQIDCLRTDGNLACLRRCPRLTRLRMHPYSVDDLGELAVFADLRHLTHLELPGMQIGDDELAYVAGLKRLQVLDLQQTLVGDAGLHLLVGLNSLKVLSVADAWPQGRPPDLRNVHYITDEGMKFVGKLTGIEELRVSCKLVTNRGVATLRDLSRLRSLNLSGTKITDSSLAEIGRFPRLKKLNVVFTEITAAGAQAFRQSHPNVRVISEGTLIGSNDL